MEEGIIFAPAAASGDSGNGPVLERGNGACAPEVIPYQWAALNDQVEGAAPSFCMHNF